MTAGASRIRVIGIGNELRGDDGAGIVAARHVRSLAPAGIDVLEQSGECGALLEAWKDADLVILIDAVRSGAPAGTIFRLDASHDPPPHDYFRHSTHDLGVADAVELGRALHSLPQRLVLYGIEGESFEMGAGLSVAVSEVVGTVARRVADEFGQAVKQPTKANVNY